MNLFLLVILFRMVSLLEVVIMTVNHMNLRNVGVASGRMNMLGVSTLSSYVTEDMNIGSERYFIMDELHDEASKVTACVIGTETAMITNSASSAISLAVAGCITKDDEYSRRHIH